MTDKLSVADVLDRAATLIEPEGAWTQQVFARNAKGQNTGLSQFRGPAVCWCALGAIDKVADNSNDAMEEAEDAMRACLGGIDIGAWNDSHLRTQSQVVSKLREAANLARERGL